MKTETSAVSKMDTIEQLTRSYASERAVLAERLGDLEDELQKVRQRRMRGIRSALAKTQDAQSALQAAVIGSRELFVRPRTVSIDGIRVGMAKGKGKIAWDDEAKVVKLIERHLPDMAETLIKTTQTPVRAALANLTTAELKKIGCRVEETGDEVMIKPQDSALDKLVARLLKEAADAGIEEEAA